MLYVSGKFFQDNSLQQREIKHQLVTHTQTSNFKIRLQHSVTCLSSLVFWTLSLLLLECIARTTYVDAVYYY